MPAQRTERQDIARSHQPHPHTGPLDSRKERGDGGHASPRIDERRVHHEFAHARIAGHIEQRAEVIEVRVRHDHRIHDATQPGDRRNQRHAPDASRRTRSSIEEDDGPARLEQVRRTIADREHRHAQRRWPAFTITRRACVGAPDHDERRREHNHAYAPHPRRPRQQHREHQRELTASSPDRNDTELDRSTEDPKRPIDQPNLQPRREPDRDAHPCRRLRPDRAENRLRIRDRKRRGRQRCACEREQCAERLDRTEVHEHDRRTREERREPRRDRARREVTAHRHPTRNRPPAVVARHPAEPPPANRRREVPERDHAHETQLEPRTRRVARCVHQHHHRRKGDHSVAVPIPPERARTRSRHGHQRRANRARRRCHHEQRDQRRHRHRHRTPSFVADEDAGDRRDHPSEHREVESRDRQDVRQPRGSKPILDRAVAILDIAEHERDQHRVDRFALRPPRHAGKQRLAHPTTQRLADARERIAERMRTPPALHARGQRKRVDRQRADHAARRRKLAEIDAPRKHRSHRRPEPTDHPQSLADFPRRPGGFKRMVAILWKANLRKSILRKSKGHQRTLHAGSTDHDALPPCTDEDDIPHQAPDACRLVEVRREDVRPESNPRASARDRDLRRHELAVVDRRPVNCHRGHRGRPHTFREPQSRTQCPRADRDKHEERPCPSGRVSSTLPPPPQPRHTQHDDRHRSPHRREQQRLRQHPRALREIHARIHTRIRPSATDPQRHRKHAGRDRHQWLRIRRPRPLAQSGRATALRAGIRFPLVMHALHPVRNPRNRAA